MNHIPLCSACETNPSFYDRQNDGQRLCSSCFKYGIEDKVRKTISAWHMLSPDDHIAVAVSGGKDSITLLMILKKLSSRFPRTRMTALTIDEGIAGYREEAVELARDYCERLNVEHVIVSFEDLFGSGLDDFLQTKTERLTACSYCGVWRRKAINLAAKNIGATKIATAHNLDDMVQTYLLNLLEGDTDRFTRFGPVLKDPKGQFTPRLKPLCEIPEKEVALYAYSEGFEFQSASCPYMKEALRNELRSIFNRLELAHPGILYSSYRAMLRLSQLARSDVVEYKLQQCQKCGEPTPFELCEACKMQSQHQLLLNIEV